MVLTDEEKAMLDGAKGPAHQKAMDLLLRYANALGAERFVETHNVAGVPGSSSGFLHDYYGRGDYQTVFSLYDLDSDEVVEVPRMEATACHLQGGLDPELWAEQGFGEEALHHQKADEAAFTSLGIQAVKSCTPYLAGNVPVRDEHCAWMESSAVVFCNSVLGARTNTEGRESTSAAMIAHRVPDWGLHRPEARVATHRVDVQVPIENILDWGMLGYFVGEGLMEAIPVLDGQLAVPDLIRHKHFGAAAASSGGTELYHMVGITPEAPTLEAALGHRAPQDVLIYDEAQRARIYESLNANGTDEAVDYVMLGCPHYSLDQIALVAHLLDGRKLHDSVRLWVFTSRAVKADSDRLGHTRTIREAGGLIMTDTCSAIGRTMPKGTKVVALDSAKQSHYLPAIMGVEAWFGTTADCIDAALSGRWQGGLA